MLALKLLLLRAMATGLYSFVAFCFVLSLVQAISLRRMSRMRTQGA